ncbi:MAG: ATP-binding protein [Gammaproteobacteria bacterium]|nr:ATP-binding protein [Gammaproteobacteria bacterium]
MSTIIGRLNEKIELEEAYKSHEAEFIAIYGRRRVGKTYLIKSFFQEKQGRYFQITGLYKGAMNKQLSRFAKELGASFYGGAPLKSPTDWMTAFDDLTRAMTQINSKEKIILFFDELPWMATRKSAILSAIEYFWNRHWSNDPRVKLIVCGSSASWIIKKIIKNRGGLHNRITRKINLLPLDLHDTAQYLKHIGYPCNYQQTCKLYMVMGGIPFYLKNIKKRYSIDQNIDNLFFHSNGMFFDEFDEVFSSLFENSEQYKEIISLIASHKDGVSRSLIDEKTKLTSSGGTLTKRLENLENSGFISSFVPYGHKKIGLFYRINDEFCYFYLRWIHSIKNQLKQGKIKKYWKDIIKRPEYFSWQGYVFENICYKHLSQIKKALDLDESSLASPWRYIPRKGTPDQGAQIDLLFDRQDRAITLCEIKYTEQPFKIDKLYAQQLNKKLEVFKNITRTDKQVFIALIAANGLSESVYSEEMISGTVLLKDLFQKTE